ncbi:hypothetical protein [Paractinoplanes rishiriensis]|uniref:Uncharacterized protein n=1 Tax=Paractinoplanes rishiriensis TaxID=1050105 RepID=A0A919N0C2_9ACTN|nr:hypothetical protein [Actinoplanes rishiriensis]GIE99440.1 hypothetical protein Ari01nite_69050 [Actinoplanes rishiriensis]
MTSPSRRRAQRAAVIAVAAVAAAGVTAAVRASRRRGEAEPEPLPPPVHSQPPARGAPPAARRNWAALIAVPAVAIVAGTVALIAARPPSTSEIAPIVLPAPSVPAPVAPVASAEPDCQDLAAWTPPPYPAAPEGPIDVGFPPCRVVVLGETVTLAAMGQLVEVTATRALDPRVEPTQQPGPGRTRRVSFRLHFESLGAGLSDLRLRPVTWAADERTGWRQPAVGSFEPVLFAPGGETDQFVAYDVGPDVRLSRLRVSLDSASHRAIAEWVIG